jgi:acyl transferase domain-containing protein
MDPQQRLLLEVTAEAFEDAGLPPSCFAGEEVGVFVGGSATDYAEVRLPDHAGADRYFMTGNALSILANRLTNVFDLRGPGATIDTACSSSLVALDAACRALAEGRMPAAIAAGVQLLSRPSPSSASPAPTCSRRPGAAGSSTRGRTAMSGPRAPARWC